MLTSSAIVLCVDSRILLEYDDVLRRPRLQIDPAKVAVLLDHIQHASEVHATIPLIKPLPDEDDSPFLEVTLSSGAACLVTGNLKHVPKPCRADARVFSQSNSWFLFESAGQGEFCLVSMNLEPSPSPRPSAPCASAMLDRPCLADVETHVS